MSQTRIVVRESALEDVEKLLAVTKLGSPSELFAILISKYGKHFAATWELPVEAAKNHNYQEFENV